MAKRTLCDYLKHQGFIKIESVDFIEVEGLYDSLEIEERGGMDVIVVPTEINYGKFFCDIYEGPSRKWKKELQRIPNHEEEKADRQLLGAIKVLIAQRKKPYVVVKESYDLRGEYLLFAR